MAPIAGDSTGSVAVTDDPAPASGGLLASLVPLLVDVALPLTATLVVSRLGYGTVASLTAGAVVPVIRTVGSVAVGHRLNRLAALMLATSVVGIVGGLIVGDPRLIVAKDGCADADGEVHRVLTEKLFPRQATVATTAEIAAALSPG